MNTAIIYDHLENIEGFKPHRIRHIEDSLELIDGTKDVSSMHSLFDVFLDETNSQLYIQVTSTSANVVFKANDEMVSELFPEYYAEQNPNARSDGQSAGDGDTSDSEVSPGSQISIEGSSGD